jgi:glycosyltransferase involved in cell wall biosynthesis
LESLAISPDTVVAIMVGRIDGMKGHDVLLEALKLSRDAGIPRFVTLIVGDGRMRENAEAAAGRAGLGPEWVRFLGFRSDISDLLSASDLFVLPSLSEGFPLSVLEAMSFGLPVIATNVGGIPELIEADKHGMLIPPGDPKTLAEAIARMVQSPQLRRSLGTAGAARVQSTFRFDHMLRQYKELYESLILRGAAGTPNG